MVRPLGMILPWATATISTVPSGGPDQRHDDDGDEAEDDAAADRRGRRLDDLQRRRQEGQFFGGAAGGRARPRRHGVLQLAGAVGEIDDDAAGGIRAALRRLPRRPGIGEAADAAGKGAGEAHRRGDGGAGPAPQAGVRRAARRDQDDLPAPGRLEFVPRHQHRPRGVRRHDDRPVVHHPADEQEAAIRQRRNGRQGRAQELFPAHPGGAGLEAVRAGEAQHGRHVHHASGMRQRVEIGRDVTQAKQHAENEQSRIVRGVRLRLHVAPGVALTSPRAARPAAGTASHSGRRP